MRSSDSQLPGVRRHPVHLHHHPSPFDVLHLSSTLRRGFCNATIERWCGRRQRSSSATLLVPRVTRYEESIGGLCQIAVSIIAIVFQVPFSILVFTDFVFDSIAKIQIIADVRTF